MKTRLVGTVVVVLLLAATVVPAAKTLDVGRNEDREISGSLDGVSKQESIPSNPLLPPIILRWVNGDWNYWSNTPHLYTIPEGNVGIGTDTPTDDLHVKGDLNYQAIFESTDAAGGIGLRADTGQAYGLLAVPADHAGLENYFVIHDVIADQTRLSIDKTGNIIISTPGAGLTFPDGTTQTTAGGGGDGGDGGWIISGANLYSAVSGNVGIGTSTPEFKLDVAGNIHISNPGSDATTLYMDSSAESNVAGIRFQKENQNRWSLQADYRVDSFMLYDHDLADPVMIWDYETGNVGIGTGFTATPTEKLQVVGNIDVSNNRIKDYYGFPHPDYDSGWIAWPDGHEDTLVHGLGGNVDNYVVDLQAKEDTYGITNMRLGGDEYPTKAQIGTGILYDYEDQGYYYKNLDANAITVRNRGKSKIDEIRVRIWVYE